MLLSVGVMFGPCGQKLCDAQHRMRFPSRWEYLDRGGAESIHSNAAAGAFAIFLDLFPPFASVHPVSIVSSIALVSIWNLE